MTYQALEMLILKWAKDKQILGKASPSTQALKTVSEIGELCDSIIKGDRPAIADALGDSLVCLIILAEMHGMNLTTCLEDAYEIISKRTGKSLDNGTFVKA